MNQLVIVFILALALCLNLGSSITLRPSLEVQFYIKKRVKKNNMIDHTSVLLILYRVYDNIK